MKRRRRSPTITPAKAQFRAEQVARITYARSACLEALEVVTDVDEAVRLLTSVDCLDRALAEYAPGWQPPENPDPIVPSASEA